MLLWADASFGRADEGREGRRRSSTPARRRSSRPTTTSTDATLGEGKRLTDQRPQVAAFTWSPGVQLVNYTSDKGDKLQAALFLPANYEKGKTYPTVVNIYEKMSQTREHRSPNPTANGFNRSVYTSNGYAVLMPDITYQVNDPGHVGGVVHGPGGQGGDRDRHRRSEEGRHHRPLVGRLPDGVPRHADRHLRGGGRRRAADRHGQHVFADLQEHRRRQQAIFESSQGRFKGGYWDNWDAYYRNSPVFFAKNVKTPLMILHNDKDGAVDFTQGVEYFNTLRRLQKPVIMLEYIGENHGLAQAVEPARLHGPHEGVLRSLPEGRAGARLDEERRAAPEDGRAPEGADEEAEGAGEEDHNRGFG